MEVFLKKLLLITLVILPLNIYAANAIHHGPIGVMGDHFHKKGEWMVSLRLANMEMKKNILNGNSISADNILKQPNPFSKMPMMMKNSESMKMPMNLSVIPKKMTMRMIMLGAMYAPSDKITLMGMAMFNDKEMTLDTHQGMMARNYLGSFETSSSDLSKISLSALFNLHKGESSRWHFIFGLEKSVGDNFEKGLVLTPMNMKATITLPYGMQSSDKALRLITGLTNVRSIGNFILGNQLLVKKVINEKDWNYGDEFEYNLWFQGSFNEKSSYSFRINYKDQDSIDGSDMTIMAPVQTANPLNYGGEVINFGIGVNAIFDIFGGRHKDRFAFEIIKPIDQNKNGLQMKDDITIHIGFQKSL
tara:strand:- start:839 stop:1921 length:1083 start_codon:yes stop_codon:yes gene_type:complete